MEGQGRPSRPCVLKRIHTADSDAVSVLLRCQLPPELGVGYRNSSSTQLRTSVSESNVSSPLAVLNPAPKSAFRTLSDGQPSSCFRRKLQSEDSSYDSDYECPPQFVLLAAGHDDVSRTVSDTLDQELGDFGAQQPPPAHCDKDPPNKGTELPEPNLINFIKFALKLGYTEQQAETVLKQLGTKPAEDEFLSGLIRLDKLSSTCTPAIRPAEIPDSSASLRYIVIDGSNVAMTHGNKERFSCRGIQICVDWFLARGHKNITVLVPMWRKESSSVEAPISDQKILLELEKDKLLIFTPSRQSPDGRRIICYDDRYILQVARDNDAIVVSNDNYRDLAAESPEFRPIIEKRILMYSFVNDRFMPPEDPLGRNGPKLDRFLRNTPAPPCPYNIRCTYGNKCKYYHPERLNNPHKSISEQLSENAHRKLREVESKAKVSREISADTGTKMKKPVQRRMTNSPVSLPPSLVEERPVRDQMYQHSGLALLPPGHSAGEESLNTHRQVSRQRSFQPEDFRMSPSPLLVPPFPPPNMAGVHSQVFRIQSAPYPVAFNPTRRLSCSSSDNQLNLLGSSTSINHLDTHVPPPLYGERAHPWLGHTLSLPASDFEKKRRDIHYHLRAILPEELVLKALQMMPEETDAVRICAAISSLASSCQTSPY